MRRSCSSTCAQHGAEYDRVLFWAYRYAGTYFGLPLVADRAVLVPTAEEDPLIHVDVLERVLRAAEGLPVPDAGRRDAGHGADGRRYGRRRSSAPASIRRRSASICRRSTRSASTIRSCCISAGSIRTRAAQALIRHFLRYVEGGAARAAGDGRTGVDADSRTSADPRARASSTTRLREALLARARALIMPSPYESLSMVLLEAWNHGLPALVNARCKVLRGQVERADGGLYYGNAVEFIAGLDYLLDAPGRVASRWAGRGWPTSIANTAGRW